MRGKEETYNSLMVLGRYRSVYCYWVNDDRKKSEREKEEGVVCLPEKEE